jgi:CheY-like chemotaxis protein
MHKVLIVDDTADARDILARLLRRHGLSALTAADGPSALSVMPEMDGIEVLQKLRGDPRFKALPVVMFTAVSDEQWFSQLASLGLGDVMIKGTVHGNELIRRIVRLLPDERASASPQTSDA